MLRLKLTIAYVGTKYSGWQLQINKNNPNIVTIQSLIEKELSRICNQSIRIFGSGRTDAGVHAHCQVAHCDIPEHKSHINWQYALNTSLPPDIRIKNFAYVSSDFHAMFDVERKAYVYRLWLDRSFLPPELYPFVWNCGKVDIEKMQMAVPYLLGKHDFSSFQNAGSSIKSSVRTLYDIKISSPSLDPENHEINLYFEANGFLRQMVRNITGLLVACGRNKFEIAEIPKLLQAKDRSKAPISAPAKGLCMARIWYKNQD